MICPVCSQILQLDNGGIYNCWRCGFTRLIIRGEKTIKTCSCKNGQMCYSGRRESEIYFTCDTCWNTANYSQLF